MDWLQALVLGVIQGLTEYLPVSSSGHLAIGSALFGVQGEDNLAFTVMVHVATVLSTLVILWKEIDWILKGLFKFEMNAETKYCLNIVVSMIPVGIVGVFFKDYVEEIFGSGLLIVGCVSASHSLAAHILLFRQAASARAYLYEGRLHHRSCPGCSCAARTLALRFYHCYRLAAWQQEGESCPVLVPYGHSAHTRRGVARRFESS